MTSEQNYECIKCGSTMTHTRAVPDVPELVRYDTPYDFNGKPIAGMVPVELGEYVIYDQAAAMLAEKDALIFEHQNENVTLQIYLDKVLKRAEAAEAELAQIKVQKPIAWMHPEGGWTDVSKAEVSAQCKPSTYPKPLYAAPVDQTAEIERLRGALKYARPLVVSYGHTQGDNAEYHDKLMAPIDTALSGKEPT